MEQLVEMIAKSLVTKPQEVKVDSHEEGRHIIINLSVNKDDLGKVIGKNGRIAKAIRNLVTCASKDSEKKYLVKIVE